jgi:uncharacterized protein YeeX (DUF496 family)
MDQKNIKERNVLTFEDFLKKQPKLLKEIDAEESKIEYGQRTITAEEQYVKHDASIYNAAGIKYKAEDADVEDFQKPGLNAEETAKIAAEVKKAAEESPDTKKPLKDAKTVADASGIVART